MKWDWKKVLGMLIGLGIAGTMLFASSLGLDNNPVWGPGRLLFFLSGIFIFTAALLYREDNFIGSLFHTRSGQLTLGAGLLTLAILAVYVWCVSVGLWTRWPETTNYFDLLATAFSHGQLALEVEPDAAILALEDPYEGVRRGESPIIWDVSLYEGKYYFYWGPTPSLLLAPIKLIHPNTVGDNILTFLFFAGTLLFLTLLILDLWKNHFPGTPRWAVLLGIVFVGLLNPIPFVLLDSQVYEAAIGSGQFFFIGGFYWLFTAFRRTSIFRLVLAGIFFTLAVGSRSTLILSVGFLALVVLVWAYRTQRAKVLSLTLAFALPIALGAVSYGWYNYSRFGSFTEFGVRYVLNSFNLHDSMDETFSIAYVPPNLFKTLVNPLERRESFPFIRAARAFGSTWFERFLPDFYLYYAEGTTGILVGSPFLIFALLAASRKRENLDWILASLAGSALMVFLGLQFFFYTAMRYLLDLVPALSLLAVIGFWNGLDLLHPSAAPALRSGLRLWTGSRRAARWIYTASGILLVMYGLAVSFLLTISSHMDRFETYNGDLLGQLAWTFNNLFK